MVRSITIIIATLTAVTALYVLIPEHLQVWAHVLSDVSRGRSLFADMSFGWIAVMIGYDAILLEKLIAAGGSSS